MDGARSHQGDSTPKRTEKNKRHSKKNLQAEIEAIKAGLPADTKIRLMFQDEGRFGRIHEPYSCWAPEGFRPTTRCQIVREYTHAYAAVSPHDGTLDSLVLPDADGVSMSIFLAEVARRHANETIVMVMDGAGWHTSVDLAVPGNMRILFLPPYSPELNPVEHIWDEMREKWFANKVFKDNDWRRKHSHRITPPPGKRCGSSKISMWIQLDCEVQCVNNLYFERKLVLDAADQPDPFWHDWNYN